jgi:hypothetical protein
MTVITRTTADRRLPEGVAPVADWGLLALVPQLQRPIGELELAVQPGDAVGEVLLERAVGASAC